MSMYNLLEYSDSYSVTLGSLCIYHRDVENDDANGNNAANYSINNNKATATRPLEYNDTF